MTMNAVGGTLFDPARLHAELVAAGVPIEGCSSTGRVDFLLTATDAQRAQAATVLSQHIPTPPAPTESRSIKILDGTNVVRRWLIPPNTDAHLQAWANAALAASIAAGECSPSARAVVQPTLETLIAAVAEPSARSALTAIARQVGMIP